jgi:hypothetical protein
MRHPDPASVLSRQNELFANIDRVFDGPVPDFEFQLPGLAREETREWATGPLLTLGRQLTRPSADDSTRDRWYRTASHLLRLTWAAAECERVSSGEGTDDTDKYVAAVSNLEWEIAFVWEYSPSDREKLKAAIREAAEPLLARTHRELYDWVIDRRAPTPHTIGQEATGSRQAH